MKKDRCVCLPTGTVTHVLAKRNAGKVDVRALCGTSPFPQRWVWESDMETPLPLCVTCWRSAVRR